MGKKGSVLKIGIFTYKNEWYQEGTEVLFTDDYIATHKSMGRKIWKNAAFVAREHRDGHDVYRFRPINYRYVIDPRTKDEYAWAIWVKCFDMHTKPDDIIEKITRPLMIPREVQQRAIEIAINKKDRDYHGLPMLWFMYIVVLIASLIFRQFYIVWFVATVVFFALRSSIINGNQ